MAVRASNAAPPTASGGGRQPFRNVLFGVAFVAHLLVLYLPIITQPENSGVRFVFRGPFSISVVLGVLVGVCWAALIMSMVQSAAINRVATLSHVAANVALGIMSLVLFVSGTWFLATCVLLLTLANIVWLRRARERVRFTATILELVGGILLPHKDLLATTMVWTAVAHGGFLLVLFVPALVRALSWSAGAAVPTLILLALSFRWCTGLIKHVLTCVVSPLILEHVTTTAMDQAAREEMEEAEAAALAGEEEAAATVAAVAASVATAGPAGSGGITPGGGSPSRSRVGGRFHVNTGGQRRASASSLDTAEWHRRLVALSQPVGPADNDPLEEDDDAADAAAQRAAGARAASGSGGAADVRAHIHRLAQQQQAHQTLDDRALDAALSAIARQALAGDATGAPSGAGIDDGVDEDDSPVRTGAAAGAASGAAAAAAGAKPPAARWVADDATMVEVDIHAHDAAASDSHLASTPPVFAGHRSGGASIVGSRADLLPSDGDHHDGSSPTATAGVTQRATAAARARAASGSSGGAGSRAGAIVGFFTGSSVVSVSLCHAMSYLLGAIAAGSLVGMANPLCWACRRAARRARRVSTAAALAHAGASAAPTPAGIRRTGSDVSSFASVLQATAAGLPHQRAHCTDRLRPLLRFFAVASAAVYNWSDAYLQVSHKYAYPVVSGQGRGFFKAARTVWRAFARSGVDALIDDDVTDRLLLAGGYVGGILLTLMLGLNVAAPDTDFASAEGLEAPPGWVWLSAALAIFAIGFTSVTLPLTLLEASVTTLFVTFARLPQAVAVLNPVVAHRWARLVELHRLAAASSRSSIASITDDTVADDL